MDRRETFALKWHLRTRDGAAFGSPTCNCLRVADRVVPMLADAWDDGHHAAWIDRDAGPHGITALNPYREARP